MERHLINRADIFSTEMYPLFLDYDFDNKRPRGGSICVDFFSFGELCHVMDSVDDDLVYIKKLSIPIKNGFFIVDYSKFTNDISKFVKLLNDIHVEKLYIASSEKFPIYDKLKDIDIDVVLVDFNG